jgi:hypothetical protein
MAAWRSHTHHHSHSAFLALMPGDPFATPPDGYRFSDELL